MEEEFFVKRKGTTDLGKDYEDLVTTSLVLRLLKIEKISDFKLSSNDAKFGAFDDIVLEITSNGKRETYAFQLKHGSRTLTLDSLGAEKGNFSIKKYFETFQIIKKNCTSCEFIIFTNLVADISDDTKISMKGESFDIQISKFNPNFYFLISGENGNCYKFEPIARDSTVLDPQRMDEYKEFFAKFLIYTNQPNYTALRKSTISMFKESFQCDDTSIDKFMKVISEWSKREGKKEKLNKFWLQQALILCLVDGNIKPLSFGEVNDRTKLFQKVISEHKVTMFEERSYERVKGIWGKANDEFKNLDEMKKLIKKYQLTSNDITSIDQIDDLLSSKLLWLMNKCPLIVTGSKITTKVLQFCPRAQFVLLGRDSRIKGKVFEKLESFSKSFNVLR